MRENRQSLVVSHTFNPADLARLVQRLVENRTRCSAWPTGWSPQREAFGRRLEQHVMC